MRHSMKTIRRCRFGFISMHSWIYICMMTTGVMCCARREKMIDTVAGVITSGEPIAVT